MLEYRAEGLCRNANHLRQEELERCIAGGEILQSTALAFDTARRLRFEISGRHAYMPYADCVDPAPGETVKDIAVLTRVGRPTCFVITGVERDETGAEVYRLSRAAAQRACEINADVLLMAKNVDGIYDSDPNLNPCAKKYEKLTFREVISGGLKAMDATAATMCMENDIPVLAFALGEEDSILRAVCGEHLGTLISNE